MTWSYNKALTCSKDRVRLMIGDTNQNKQLLQNEEIEYFLTLETNPMRAAALAARSIAATFSSKADTTFETVSVSYSQKAKAFLTMADQLETQSRRASAMAGPSATGISVSEMAAADTDMDRPAVENKKGMFDNPPRSTRDPRINGVS